METASPTWLRRGQLSTAKRRQFPQMTTLRASQRRQTETPPPNTYAEGNSAQLNGEAATESPRSRPVSVAKRRCHHQTATLTAPQHHQTAMTPPNSHAQPRPSVAKRRQFPQMTTLRTHQRRQTVTASPFAYAYSPSASPNGDAITEQLC